MLNPRIGVFHAVVLAVGLGLLLAAGRSAAQAPPAPASPANPDAEKRLRTLEEKMDRVLQLLEAREHPPRTSGGDSTAAIRAARDKLVDDLKASEQRYAEFRAKTPFLTGQPGSINFNAERLAQIDKRRSELLLKRTELTDRLARIEKERKEHGNEAAKRLIAATGTKTQPADEKGDAEKVVKVLKLKRETLLLSVGENHPTVKQVDEAIALVRQIYSKDSDGAAAMGNNRAADDVDSSLALMRAEITNSNTLIESLNNLFDKEVANARALGVYQVQEERLRQNITRLRQAIGDLEKHLGPAQGQPLAK